MTTVQALLLILIGNFEMANYFGKVNFFRTRQGCVELC